MTGTSPRRVFSGAAFSLIYCLVVTLQAADTQTAYSPGDIYLGSSRVYALVGKTGLGHEHGVVGQLKSGRLMLGAPRDAGEMVFDMQSFVADTTAARRFVGLEGESSESTREQVTANMLSPDVLNVAKHPTARFVITSATPLASDKPEEQQFELTGSFTLYEITRPLKVTAKVTMDKGWQRVRGGFRLKQSDYGITPFKKAFGAIGVADEMTVWADLWVAPTAGETQQAAQTTAGARR